MKLVPFLNFGGNCADAFAFYAKALDGNVVYSITYGNSPAAADVPASAQNQVMFTHLIADGAELMGADDCMGPFTPPSGMRASLHMQDIAQAERVYAALSEGGNILMPLTETFWSHRFSMFTDKFGTPWMINCEKPMEAPMKYMLLIYADEATLTDAVRQPCYEESTALAVDLHTAGKFISAAPLQPTSAATTVRVREGKRLVTDGPFAETREQLGGYFMVDAADLDDAISIASRIPMARAGTVEIRPVIEIPGLPEG